MTDLGRVHLQVAPKSSRNRQQSAGSGAEVVQLEGFMEQEAPELARLAAEPEQR